MKPQEPLTAEERALAEQLARLGPHGEPSPALDARILAAAHAEISRPSAAPKPRWPVAFGLAASALLAVGVAWQLRPVDEAPMISEAPVAAEMPAEQAAMGIPETADSSPALAKQQEPDAAAAAAAETAPTAPPVLDESSPATQAKPLPAAPKAEARQAPAKPRRAEPVTPSPPAASRSASAPISAPRQLPSAPLPAPPPPAAESAEAETISLPLPPPAPAPASAPASQARAAFASEPASEREVSGYITRSENDSYRYRTPNAAADAAAQRSRRQEQRALADEGQALDKVTVSGSRLQRTDLQVPVHDDARLTPDEWLERIRLRRDLGDGASAAASLRLYVQEHPFRKVPEDLRPLLAE